jgi:AraC family transcriptional regulator
MLILDNIVAQAIKEPVMSDKISLLFSSSQSIENQWSFDIAHYQLSNDVSTEELSVFYYIPNTIQLAFARMLNNNGTQYCTIYIFTYNKQYIDSLQLQHEIQTAYKNILDFTQPVATKYDVIVCNRIRNILDNALQLQDNPVQLQLQMASQLPAILKYGIENILEEKEMVFTCKFLANVDDRLKIMNAKDVLLENLGEQLTIKELSRRVAINECYLKKGFKEIFGSTIFEFYQNKRMEYAHSLLFEEGKTVTQVAEILGYSNISHFSTAFKKHTGIKPCELLFRQPA